MEVGSILILVIYDYKNLRFIKKYTRYRYSSVSNETDECYYSSFMLRAYSIFLSRGTPSFMVGRDSVLLPHLLCVGYLTMDCNRWITLVSMDLLIPIRSLRSIPGIRSGCLRIL